MRYAVVLAALVGLVAAQSSTTTCIVPTSTLTGGGVSTVTQTYTSTYCPACEEVTTTYETVWTQVCPTGLTSGTYTITETYAGNSSCTGVPSGYTTEAQTCTAGTCSGTVITATVPVSTAATATTPSSDTETVAVSSAASTSTSPAYTEYTGAGSSVKAGMAFVAGVAGLAALL